MRELRTSRCSSWILEKAEEAEIKQPTSPRIIEKAREFQKNIYFCFIDYAKAFDSVDQKKLWKILKEMGKPEHLTWLLRNMYTGPEAAIRIGNGTMDWFQKGVPQAVYCCPAYLTYMMNTSCKMLGWSKHKLESR